MLVPPTTPSLHAAHAFVRRRTLRGLLRLRFLVTPAIALLATGVAFLDPAPWRITVMAVTVTTVFVLSYIEARVDRDMGDVRFIANVAVTALGQVVIVFASGGLASPLMPALILFAMLIAFFTPRAFAIAFVGLVHIPALWIFAVVQAEDWVPGIVLPAFHGLYVESGTSGEGPYLAAAVYTLLIFAGSNFGSFFRKTVDELVRQYVTDQERTLNMHAEQSRTLTALSAEIAHELKNPLASVKGLAALVRKDVEGTTAERVDVLRREVDRMQAILAEFLDYSRPLIPLEAEEVDVTALAREVAALHEGMARQHGLSLEVSPEEPVHHSADPRKLRAVLINLVQNAIEASPDGAGVRIEIAHERGGDLAIRVIDQGSGIDPHIVGKLFTVGATTKAKGNGLGLAVARGLARQHGGELDLRASKGGGTVAELMLPRDPPPASALGAAA
jgi:two-component system, NtrC family, sensor histidine kinase HydH